MNSTARRVPLIMGFPTRIFGSRDMRSCQLIIDHIMWTIKMYFLHGEGKEEAAPRPSFVSVVIFAVRYIFVLL